MNRSGYFSEIEQKLNWLAARIEVRGQLNILDFNVHAEYFYRDLFNLLYALRLDNHNQTNHNAEGIDLIDNTNRTVVQVSSTATRAKIESALCRVPCTYAGYRFMFISISKDASKLKNDSFNNPKKLSFDPKTDIYDVPTILRDILALDITRQKTLYDFIREELTIRIDPTRIESNLASIIGIISADDLNHAEPLPTPIAFHIDDKIDYNQLQSARHMIDDYKIYHTRIERIYAEFNKSGSNKSTSVLQIIRREYLEHKGSFLADELFFKIANRVRERVLESANYVPLPLEELELCVDIVVVDAFIRCKIFENPVGRPHVAP